VRARRRAAGAQELAFRATSLTTLAQMVASGAGVTLLPTCAVATEAGRAGLDVREFAAPAPHRTIVLAWRRRSPLEAGLRRLAATLRESYPGDGAVGTKPKKGRAGAPRRRDAAR
jgi:LysR family hydrogen peroxide-inducible transcriptional activator